MTLSAGGDAIQELTLEELRNKVGTGMEIEDAEEHIDGQLKRKLGKVFIRGDTIILISAA